MTLRIPDYGRAFVLAYQLCAPVFTIVLHIVFHMVVVRVGGRNICALFV